METQQNTEWMQEVLESEDCFNPAHVLPVEIDFITNGANPYKLSQDVTYISGPIKVDMEKGFAWDGASIPVWLPILPWLGTLLAMHVIDTFWLLIATALLVLYTIRLLPYMQKMGLHARGAAVHDKLYRAQKTTRLIADGIFDSIMETDGVPYDVRWMIYRRVRNFGWLAWALNKRNIPARKEAAKDVEVTK